MKTKEMNVGFVGLGSISDHYINVISNYIPNIIIRGVYDIDKTKRSVCDNLKNAKFYTNLRKMLKQENLDACFILTPSGAHFESCKICLEENVNTFVEKPITLNVEQADELINLAKMKNLILGVVYQNRFNKPIKLAKKLINQGAFGRRVLTSIRLLWSRDNNYYKGWRGTWKMDGGVMAQQAIHHLDMIQWLNAPIKEVYCVEKTIINNLEAEDTSIGTITFSDGSLGSFQLTTAARPKDLEASITILGEKGMIEIGGISLNKIINIDLPDLKTKSKKLIQEHSEFSKKGFGNGHIEYLKSIYENFLSDIKVAPVSAMDAKNSLQLVHALYKSSEKNRPVNFNKNNKSKRLGV